MHLGGLVGRFGEVGRGRQSPVNSRDVALKVGSRHRQGVRVPSAATRYHQAPWPSSWLVRSSMSEGAACLQHEEELRAAGRVSISADRRKDKITRRLAGLEPPLAICPIS